MSTVNPMNERIRELAEQASLDNTDRVSCVFDVNKFAELIVRECAEIAHEQEFGEGWDGPVKDKILDRFGLKDVRWYP